MSTYVHNGLQRSLDCCSILRTVLHLLDVQCFLSWYWNLFEESVTVTAFTVSSRAAQCMRLALQIVSDVRVGTERKHCSAATVIYDS